LIREKQLPIRSLIVGIVDAVDVRVPEGPVSGARTGEVR